jgi:uncharacterized membrane protein YpjA
MYTYLGLSSLSYIMDRDAQMLHHLAFVQVLKEHGAAGDVELSFDSSEKHFCP